MDLRIFQILVLLALLLVGVVWGRIEIAWSMAWVLFPVGVLTHLFFNLVKKQNKDLMSSLITCLSLLLLFRGDNYLSFSLAAFLAIAGKELIRIKGHHIFNPSNFAIVIILILGKEWGWVSSGQWGTEYLFVIFVALLGVPLLGRVGRLDSGIYFLIFYMGGHLIRHLYLGDPLTIWWHRLGSGGLWIFSLLMITDPKTTPFSSRGRIFFSLLVAMVGLYVELWWYHRQGIFLGLFFSSLLLPIFNKIYKSEEFKWEKLSYPY